MAVWEMKHREIPAQVATCFSGARRSAGSAGIVDGVLEGVSLGAGDGGGGGGGQCYGRVRCCVKKYIPVKTCGILVWGVR